MNPTSPNDIVSIEPFKLDLPKAIIRYDSKPEKNIVISKLRTEGRPFLLRFTGEMATNGINDKEFDKPNGTKQVTFSIGIQLDDTLVDSFARFHQDLVDHLHADFADFEVLDLIKDSDKIYVKLKVDRSGKTFTCPTNLKISPKNYSEAATAQSVTFIGELGSYFNLAEKKAGLMLTPRRILFDDDGEPVQKKARKE